MRLDAFLVAEMLQRMEHNGALLRPHAAEIAASISREQYEAARKASALLQRALEAFVATTELLRKYVVSRDGLGEAGDSVELALRARVLVFSELIPVLCEALAEPALRKRVSGWLAGSLRSVEELASFVTRRLVSVRAIWMPYRPGEPQPPGMTDGDRASLHRTTIRVALRALSALRTDPDFARLLDEGLAATDLPVIHGACTQIIAVLDPPTDLGPAHRGSRGSSRGEALPDWARNP